MEMEILNIEFDEPYDDDDDAPIDDDDNYNNNGDDNDIALTLTLIWKWYNSILFMLVLTNKSPQNSLEFSVPWQRTYSRPANLDKPICIRHPSKSSHPSI